MGNEVSYTLHRGVLAVGDSGIKYVNVDKNVLLTNCSRCGIMGSKMADTVRQIWPRCR